MASHRLQRSTEAALPGELRNPFEKDRDRLLYSHAFLRLAGVTQISSTNRQGQHHFRLAHSIKVGQVGAALARTLIERYESVVPEIADYVHPHVVEAAGLAHDIGHPPTGHNGEKTLDAWSRDQLGEPFEGNAQTFRILTYLGDRTFDYPGFDLTRATLLASTKYPWPSSDQQAANKGKFGCFERDRGVFEWAAKGTQVEKGVASLEAQLMDWADDITYAIHDVQDYFRSGDIKLHELIREGSDEARKYAEHLWGRVNSSEKERDDYKKIGYLDDKVGLSSDSPDEQAFIEEVCSRLAKLSELFVGLVEMGPYEGSHEQRCVLVRGAAHFLGRLIEGPTEGLSPVPFRLEEEPGGVWMVRPDERMLLDVLLLKGLTFWSVVPNLADEQSAESARLGELVQAVLSVLRGERSRILRGELEEVRQRFSELSEIDQGRYVLDYIAGLSDEEFKALYALYCRHESGAEYEQIARGAPLPPWPFGRVGAS